MASSSNRSPWRNSAYTPPRERGNNPSPSYKSPRGRPSSMLNSDRKPSIPAGSPNLPPDRDIMEGLINIVVTTIKIPSATRDDEDVRINNCQYIGSYSWTNRASPTIIVPGSPPQWQNRSPPYNVQPDIGLFFVDQNGFRMPKAPFVPLITAVNTRSKTNHQLEFDWSDVDIVTDRNALRKLVRWVKGDNPRDFRIDLQLAGDKTVLMNRWEKRTQELFSGRTYGFSFEKASTLPAPDCREATGHHRIVSYDLNGLKMVVRFEVDACIPPAKSGPRKSTADVDELAASLASVSLSSKGEPPKSGDRFSLDVVEGGTEVSPLAVMELSTRSEYRQNEYDWTELYPQLFFSQTAHHVLAIHNRGRFAAIHKRKLNSPEFQDLDAQLQPHFKGAHKALKIIQDLVVEHGQRGRLTLVCIDGVLAVYERTSMESSLPDHMMALFH